MVLRIWSPTTELRIWDWTMQAENWVSVNETEKWVLCDWVKFSIVAAAIKFFGSRSAKMNWDLKHHEICRTLGMVSIVRIVSLSPRVEEPKSEVNKPFVPEQRSHLCVCIAFVFCICICTVGLISLLCICVVYKKYTSWPVPTISAS